MSAHGGVEGILLTEPVPLVHTKKFFAGFMCGTLSIEFYDSEQPLANICLHTNLAPQISLTFAQI